ncbi:malate:quinone oxidoreductase [Azotobacter vinelandii CA]|uniref:Probable malate:quinone oxidoreductase n=2 Tax=Azotobacter vinelandii TaxID=354 RepID=C1DJ81_AZOVD|nr:malate:quinone oxidoreductase [Azotobacter vinelandii]ACO76666.1 malate:quinone-oxidoreductase [Azotobacter vinelandii DJ]AGK13001.1 malate:quinone oxidoreductase [Azotobacter vinelandii CA]AGK18315.1 malate:quinone oxidoreductase [Azotobacter vinelandii CA6]SFX13353.1 malate dehydrogenase (quinone) [Azotobacter vinelandii]GLK58840.1 putative malate:quinone oxidoreductase 1 [Azotobacter vinelandii]
MKKLLLTFLCASIVGCAKQDDAEKTVDVLLIGGGIMSASLGTYLKELEPDWTIDIYERLDQVAEESSNPWNNAGTGHSAFCELNYTSEKPDGHVDISKALAVTESFEISRQFWAHQIDKGVLSNPKSFINDVPHISFVWGDENVAFLKKRHEAMQHSSLYRGMEYTEDHATINEWAPLVMEGRTAGQKVAATRMPIGTDVNFGEITRQLMGALTRHGNVTLNLKHEVRDFVRNDDGTWNVTVADLAKGGEEKTVKAKFVFIGAGGGALPLLQKTGIPEADGYAGFPVGGQFLYTTNPEVVERHLAKVYGKASVGAPPMSVPHLDTRVIDGKRAILFGPFATFSTKFLKKGSLLDMPRSLSTDNFMPIMHAGLDNLPLSTYLIGQLMLSQEERIEELREYFPQAKAEDWKLLTAGQRVQVIKKDPEKGGVLQFGTEVVAAADGSIAALLGASPGASTAAPIMLTVLEKTFKDRIGTPEWQAKLKEIVPSYGQKLNNNIELTNNIRAMTSERLQLRFMPVEPEAAEAQAEATAPQPAQAAL